MLKQYATSSCEAELMARPHKSATSFCRLENFCKPIDKLSFVCYNYNTVQMYRYITEERKMEKWSPERAEAIRLFIDEYAYRRR